MDNKSDLTKRQRLEIMRSQLQQERSSFEPLWRDLGDFILPMRPRFQVNEKNRGQRKNQKIIDTTASIAARTLSSGMMSGITSPARPWFRLTHPNPEFREIESVREWLHQVTQDMATVFLKSNLYNALPLIYRDMSNFGTACMFVEEDMRNIIHCHVFPVGSYSIGVDSKGRVRKFHHEEEMTVKQIIDDFAIKDKEGRVIDWSNISAHVKHAYLNGQHENKILVDHLISENWAYDDNKLESKYKRFQSCYYERGIGNDNKGYLTGAEKDIYLRESGYDVFPVLAPRWDVTGNDSYGTDCPGMTAIGDIKQLQVMERLALQGVEKTIKPPMKAPTALKKQKVTSIPGDVTYVDEQDGKGGYSPAYQIDFRVDLVELKQQQVRRRIEQAYFADLVLMISNDERQQRATATEITAAKEELLVAFGPVLEGLNQDVLNPLIDLGFYYMGQREMIPEAPPELEGIDLRVEYISVMAQAQKLVGLGNVERFTQFFTSVSQFDPRVVNKVDGYELIDTYADMTSMPPKIVRTDEEAQAIEDAQAQRAQAQAQAEQIKLASSAARDLSQTDLDGNNALSQLVGPSGAA